MCDVFHFNFSRLFFLFCFVLQVFGDQVRREIKFGARSFSFSSLSSGVSGQDIDGQGGLKAVVIGLFLTNCPLGPVHPEDGTEHNQKQRHLQEYEEQEVDAVRQGPVGGTQ